MSRRTIQTSVVLTLAMLASACSGGFKIPGMESVPGLSAMSGGGASSGFEAKLVLVERQLDGGTASMLRALSEIAEAVDKKDLAAKYEASAKTIEEGNVSDEEYETTLATISETSLSYDDLENAKSSEALSQLGQSTLFLGLAGFLDAGAVATAGAIIASPPSASEMVMGGARALSVAKMVASTLPTHVTLAADWTGQITEYLKSRNVSVPSQEEARNLAQKMEIPSDLLDEFPSKN